MLLQWWPIKAEPENEISIVYLVVKNLFLTASTGLCHVEMSNAVL
jgi:hypothetical protein